MKVSRTFKHPTFKPSRMPREGQSIPAVNFRFFSSLLGISLCHIVKRVEARKEEINSLLISFPFFLSRNRTFFWQHFLLPSLQSCFCTLNPRGRRWSLLISWPTRGRSWSSSCLMTSTSSRRSWSRSRRSPTRRSRRPGSSSAS